MKTFLIIMMALCFQPIFTESELNAQTNYHITKKGNAQGGLAADQLKAVYPELVCEDEKGNVGINYVEMVPLLVQCLNEQREEIAELRDDIAELKGEDCRSASRKRGRTAEANSAGSGTDIIY